MSSIKVILFDLGNVLIRWNGAPLMEELIPDEAERQAFWPHFMAWNLEGDRGNWRAIVPAFTAAFPRYRAFIEAYPERFREAVPGVIEESVEILRACKARGHKVLAASNWAADLFAMVEGDYPFLSLFDGKQISGRVGLVKPDADFFERMMKDFDFKPEEAVFIDDTMKNVEAAQKLGLHALLFTDPAKLRADLVNLGVLAD